MRGHFRADLFYRLNVFPLEVPPLRDRRLDIPELAMFFLQRFSKRLGKRIETVSQSTLDQLLAYSWPGNIRELHNVIERAVVLSQGSVLAFEDNLLPADVSVFSPGAKTHNAGADCVASEIRDTGRSSAPCSLEDVERRHILMVLEKTGGLIDGPNGAARILKINPSTLRGRMNKMGIKRKQSPNIVEPR
jgi:formate hydrogenlyase transcriptional activator